MLLCGYLMYNQSSYKLVHNAMPNNYRNMNMKRLIIDVREPIEFKEDAVDGAINVPLSTIESNDKVNINIPKHARLIVYCRSGNRASSAILLLEAMGYTNLVNGINKQNVENVYLH